MLTLDSLEFLFQDPFANKVATALLALSLIYLASNLLTRSIERRVHDNAIRYKTRKAVTLLRYLAAAVALGMIFSERLGSLTVVFGVAGAGIAFALQEVIASVAGWIAISSGGFYSTGDRVQLGGIKGDVIDIGVLRTTLMEVGQWVNADLYNGRIVKVANSFVFKEPVFNYSADFPFLWDEITLPVRYGSDWVAAKAMLIAVGNEVCAEFARQSHSAWSEAVVKYQLEDAAVEPIVTMVANDNWLEFTLRYVVDYRRRRSVKDQLFTRILQEVDASNARIRLASATFELVNMPNLDIRADGSKVHVSSRYQP